MLYSTDPEASTGISGIQMGAAAKQVVGRYTAADKALTAVLMDDEDRMLLALDHIRHGKWDSVPEALENADNWRKAGRIPGGAASNIAASSASMLRDRAKKNIASLKTDFAICTAAEYQADRRRAAPLVTALIRAVEQFRRTLLEAKLAEKVLDYADLDSHTACRYQPGKTKQLKAKPPRERPGRQQEVAVVSKAKETHALLKKR